MGGEEGPSHVRPNPRGHRTLATAAFWSAWQHRRKSCVATTARIRRPPIGVRAARGRLGLQVRLKGAGHLLRIYRHLAGFLLQPGRRHRLRHPGQRQQSLVPIGEGAGHLLR